MRSGKIVKATFAVVLVVAGLVAVRAWLEPKEAQDPEVDLSTEATKRIAMSGEQSRVDEKSLEQAVGSADVLLVGEDHFYRETNEFLTRTLSSVEGRRVTLLLEIPEFLQPAVDEYVATGRSPSFDEAVRNGESLPFQQILAWAHRNRAKVSRVVAFDEGSTTIFLNRALLRDTRNETMADAILAARMVAPQDLVVAYGGQLHMILAGRYRYDIPNRTPAGALLLTRGVDRARLVSVMLSGKGKSPAADILPAGIYAASAQLGDAPFAYFIQYPIFRASTARELFDFYANLGELTRVGGK